MVKQHRGAINLAVTYSSMRLLLLPHFAATYFHMQEDKSPFCGEKKQRKKKGKKQRETEHRQTEAGSETKCQALQ